MLLEGKFLEEINDTGSNKPQAIRVYGTTHSDLSESSTLGHCVALELVHLEEWDKLLRGVSEALAEFFLLKGSKRETPLP